jgi:hypothetical protein
MAREGGNSRQVDDRPQAWLQALIAYDVACLVLDLADDRELVSFFEQQPGWAVDFKDEQGVLFVRRSVAPPPPRTADGP